MSIRSREYHGEEDYRRIRELLIESYAITKRHHNWSLARLVAFRFGRYGYQEISGERTWPADFRLWETASGKLVGVVHPEAPNYVFLQIHPHYRHIEEEMLDWAELHHAKARPREPLHTFVREYDPERAALLAQRGFKNLGRTGVHFCRSLEDKDGDPLPDVVLPAGYVVRTVRHDAVADVARQAAAVNLVFNTDFTPEAMRVIMGAPMPHTDLVVVAPDGTFVAFCTIWFDEDNRTGVFEPVGTHPDHRRRGLGRAVMTEALHRLRGWGAVTAIVETGYDSPASRFYESLGFTITEVESRYRKECQGDGKGRRWGAT